MKVTANILLNYIRCRRYASLNDPDLEYQSPEYEVQSHTYFQDYLDIFLAKYGNTFKNVKKNVKLSYDFHPDVVLYENYHFIGELTNNQKEIYCLIPSTSKDFLKIRYSEDKHKYQLFNKNSKGIYEIKEGKLLATKTNYLEKLDKLKKRTEDIGRIVYNYAFKQFVYNTINPGNNTKVYMVLLNGDYVYDGKDYNKSLYHIFDFSLLFDGYNETIEADVYRMINHIELNDFTPCNLVKKECRKGDSFECKFTKFCFSHLPKGNSILDYFSAQRGFDETSETGEIHHDTYDLINEGKVNTLDIPISWLKDEKHLMQRYCIETDYTHVHRKKIETMLKTLKYPLIYLDFEASPCLLPRYSGEKPFTQSVFQYSVHIEKTEGKLSLNDKYHYEFIANHEYDNRRELVLNLIRIVNKYDSTVIVYHKTFEEQRLKELQTIFPEYKEDLQNIINRLFDLKDVLKNNKKFYMERNFTEYEANRYNFYSQKLSGSYSLKKVIKVFNESAYYNLEIRDGKQAFNAYMRLNDLEPTERDKTINNLLEYCKQDTYSMFEIIQGLKKHLSVGFTII
ncbi:DUF2779 domain-containing protein [Mycoplasmatota bacterium WC30]